MSTQEDDPRHGTIAGYNRIPCRETCCKKAMAKYKANRELDLIAGKVRIVPAIGTQRRLQALAVLGWSNASVARRMGMHPEHMPRLIANAVTINAKTAERATAVYRELSMRIPVGTTRQEKQSITCARTRANRNGWLPPLAWDDETIDDPGARPRHKVKAPRKTDLDPVVVERFLDGDYHLATTYAEKREIAKQWADLGRSGHALEKATGWNSARLYREEKAS